MFIPDPDFYTSPTPNLGSRLQKQQQKRGMKEKFCCHTFLFSHKFHKIENYFSFEVLKKKIWANYRTFYQKNCHCAAVGFLSGIFSPNRDDF